MKLSKQAKENIGAMLLTAGAVIVAIQANNYLVNPAVAKVKGMMSKPVVSTPTPETK